MRVLGEEVEFHTIPPNLSPSFFLDMNNRYVPKWKMDLVRKIGLLGLNDVSRLAPIGDLDYMNGWFRSPFFPSQGTWMNGGMEKAIYNAAHAQGYRFEIISHRETGSDTCYYCKDLHMYYHVDSSG